jgi:DNA polymerase (family X)
MRMNNQNIAGMLAEVADLLAIQGANPFRVRAYRNAARTLNSRSESISDMLKAGCSLSHLPGIGEDLAGKIKTIVETGSLPMLDALHADVPGEPADILRISGIGPKKVAALYKELNISSLDDLKEAAEKHRICALKGFGPTTETNILEEIERLQGHKGRRTRLDIVEQIAEPLVKYLNNDSAVTHIHIAGSYRRRKETVRDLDIVVTCKQGTPIMDRFVNYDGVKKIISRGNTRSSVLLGSGFQVDLRVVPHNSFGAALMYFTGSKEHSIAMRTIAARKKWKLNEYGIFKGDKRLAGKTEQSMYQRCKLPWIPPELRENRGEIEAAQAGDLPRLLTGKDIRGDLHVHTNRTDGRNTLAEMADAAKKLGYAYIALCDHSQRVTVAHGLKPKDVHDQIREIDRYNQTHQGIRILKSIEVDILKDGSLDLPDEILARLDMCVCSVHSHLKLPRDEQTQRVIQAMKNPHCTIVGHPSGRLINERPPCEMDIKKIMEAAKKHHCMLELNAHPDRLDLTDIHCTMAKDMGVPIVISTDAHHIDHLAYMRFGVGQARRGWLEKKDVLNTRTLTELLSIIKK